MQFHHRYIQPKITNILCKGKCKGERLLDIGAGDGSLTRIFADMGFIATGIEISTELFAQAVKMFPDIDFVNKDIYDVTLKDLNGPFDVITAVEVIEHLPRPRRFIDKASSLLKPGGMLLLTTPYHGYIKNLLIALFNMTERHYNPLVNGWHIKFFSGRSISALLSGSGFKDIKFWYVGRFPFLWKSMIITCIK